MGTERAELWANTGVLGGKKRKGLRKRRKEREKVEEDVGKAKKKRAASKSPRTSGLSKLLFDYPCERGSSSKDAHPNPPRWPRTRFNPLANAEALVRV